VQIDSSALRFAPNIGRMYNILPTDNFDGLNKPDSPKKILIIFNEGYMNSDPSIFAPVQNFGDFSGQAGDTNYRQK
jgi:hypothetical protein